MAAAGYALVYLAMSYGSQLLGDDPEGDEAARLQHEEDYEEEDDHEERGTWLEELGWKLLAWVIIAVSAVWLFVLFNAKSIFVIAGFAALTPGVSTSEFLAVIAISGTLQLIAMNAVIIPLARRRGISL